MEEDHYVFMDLHLNGATFSLFVSANVAFDEVLILLEMSMKENIKNVHLDISKTR